MSEAMELAPYEAMDTKDGAAKHRLIVRLASRETLRLKYPDIHLIRVSADQSVMAVFCFSINIVIRGRNLEAIAVALDGEYVAGLQQFDATRWPEPADHAAPFISSIEFYMKKDEEGPEPDKSLATGQAESRAKH